MLSKKKKNTVNIKNKKCKFITINYKLITIF